MTLESDGWLYPVDVKFLGIWYIYRQGGPLVHQSTVLRHMHLSLSLSLGSAVHQAAGKCGASACARTWKVPMLMIYLSVNWAYTARRNRKGFWRHAGSLVWVLLLNGKPASLYFCSCCGVSPCCFCLLCLGFYCIFHFPTSSQQCLLYKFFPPHPPA